MGKENVEELSKFFTKLCEWRFVLVLKKRKLFRATSPIQPSPKKNSYWKTLQTVLTPTLKKGAFFVSGESTYELMFCCL